MSLRDLGVLQNLLLTGNKYLIKVHFFWLQNYHFMQMVILKTLLGDVHFISCYFLKAHKTFVLNILISAQAQVLEL